MQLSDRAAGNIYDLGYRSYEGVRLGRRAAVLALYTHSLRTAFGLGRRTSSKILPVSLAIITLIPAAIQLGIAAVASNIIEVYRAESYYTYVQIVLALFCAAVAPELVGRDQRNRTLSLYFSRSLLRRDYALARFGGLASAMLILTLGPQAVLFVGNGLAGNDLGGYLRDNADQVPPIVASGVFISAFIAALGLAIASQTPRRAYSSVGIVATFVVASPVVATLVRLGGDAGHYAIFLSPFHVMQGLTFWLFGAQTRGEVEVAAQPGGLFLVAMLAVIALAAFVVNRRYERMPA